MPAIWAIRERHPDAHLTLLTNSQKPGRNVSAWDVAGPTGVFNGVVEYDATARSWRKLRTIAKLARSIRQLAPDRVYYLAPSPRTEEQARRDGVFLRFICGVRDVIGLEASSDWLGRRDDRGHLEPRPAEQDRLAAIVSTEPAKWRPLPIGADERAAVDRLWRESELPADARLFALGTSAKGTATRWMMERYEELGRRLLMDSPSARLLLLGGAMDQSTAEAFREKLGPRVVTWAGKLSIWGSAEALRRCVLYVGNNTGTMHLAAAVGTPCVTISSARGYPGMWEAQGEGHVVLYRNVPCAGCMLQHCVDKDLVCLTSISVDEVFAACEKVMAVRANWPGE